MSNIIQKVKDVISGDSHTTDPQHDSTHRGTTGTTGVGSTNTDTYDTGNRTGPHRSDMANKMDPRIDSDRDGSHKKETTWGTGGITSGTGSGGHGTHHDSTHHGPHDTGLGKLDPRTDSARDSTHRVGGTGGYSGGGFNTTHDNTHHQPGNIVLNKPHDTTTGTHHDSSRPFGSTEHGTTHGATGAGPHNSNLMNKLDPRTDSDRNPSHNTGTFMGGTGLGSSTHHNTSTTAGPHDSNIANKLDPRAGSDRDASHNTGTFGTAGTGMTGTTGTHHGHGSGTHDSAHVPSALGASPLNTTAIGSHHTQHGNTHTGPSLGGITGSGGHHDDTHHNKDTKGGLGSLAGMVPTTGTRDHTHGTGVTGTHHDPTSQHSSSVGNKFDNTSGTHHTQHGNTHTGPSLGGIVGTGGHHDNTHHNKDTKGGLGSLAGIVPTGGTRDHTHGTGVTGTHHDPTSQHSSSMGNKLDPRFDSTRDHHTNPQSTTGTTGSHTGSSGLVGGTHSSTGPAPNTAGPHKSDWMNKLDPRVDSDLDGSKTIGGNKTFSNTGSGTNTHETNTHGTNTHGTHNTSGTLGSGPGVDGYGTTGRYA